MGTNFYALRKIEKKERKNLHQKLDDLLSGTIDDYTFQDSLKEAVGKIHLGKRSGGWQFLWEYHPDLYPDNLSGIMDFLLSGEYTIKDEYGETFTLSEFIDQEIGESLYTGYNHNSWIKDHPEERSYIPFSHYDWITSDGLRFIRGDFS